MENSFTTDEQEDAESDEESDAEVNLFESGDDYFTIESDEENDDII